MSEEELLDARNQMWRNFCISDGYEPGSTAKPMVVAAALELGVVSDSDTFLCDGGQTVVEGQPRIKCAKRAGHGIITLEGSLMFSCNDALMQIGTRLGYENYLKYQEIFNFGLKTNIDLPGEANNASTVFQFGYAGRDGACDQLLRTGLQCNHGPAGFCLFLCDQRRLLLSAPCGEEDSGRGRRDRGDEERHSGAPDGVGKDLRPDPPVPVPYHVWSGGFQWEQRHRTERPRGRLLHGRQDRDGPEISAIRRKISGILHRLRACGQSPGGLLRGGWTSRTRQMRPPRPAAPMPRRSLKTS